MQERGETIDWWERGNPDGAVPERESAQHGHIG